MNSVPLISPIDGNCGDHNRNWAVILTILSLPMPLLATAWLAFRFM